MLYYNVYCTEIQKFYAAYTLGLKTIITKIDKQPKEIICSNMFGGGIANKFSHNYKTKIQYQIADHTLFQSPLEELDFQIFIKA